MTTLTGFLETHWVMSGALAAAALALAALMVVWRWTRRSSEFDDIRLKTVLKIAFKPFVTLLPFGLVAPRTRGLNRHSLPFWTWVNVLAVALLILHSPSPLTLSIATAVLAIHLLCFVGVLLMIDEETDVWNGLILASRATFGSAKFIKTSSVLLISAVFALLLTAEAVWLWDAIRSERRMIAVPPDFACGGRFCSYLQYLVAVIYEIPGLEWALRQIQPHGKATLTEGLGNHLRIAINFAAVTLIFGVFKIVVAQRKAINDLIVAFGRAKDQATLEYLRLRAERAPESVLEKIVERALRHHNPATRLRFAEAAITGRIHTFPAIFIQNLDRERDTDNKRIALAVIRQVMEADGEAIAVRDLAKILAALKEQTDEKAYTKRVQRQLDNLVVLTLGLLSARNQRVAADDVPERLYVAAILGDDGVRQKAVELASRIRPFDLCLAFPAHIRIDLLKDDDTRAWLKELLFATERIIREQGQAWGVKRRRKLCSSFKTAVQELAPVRQQLAAGKLPGTIDRLTTEQRIDLLGFIDEATAAAELFCELLTKPVPQDNEPPPIAAAS